MVLTILKTIEENMAVRAAVVLVRATVCLKRFILAMDLLLVYFFFFLIIRPPPRSPLFPSPPLSRSRLHRGCFTALPPQSLQYPRRVYSRRRAVSTRARTEAMATADHREGTAHGAALRWTRGAVITDRKSTRLNSSHSQISYAVFCLK